jgi:hypothetical protein
VTSDAPTNSISEQSAVRPAVAWCAAAGCTFVLYALTAAPDVLWGDSGNAQLRAYLGHYFDADQYSRSHILFYLLAAPLARISGSAAHSTTLVSAAAGAITVGNIAFLLSTLAPRRVAIFAAVATIGLSHSLWHLSTVAEVVTLSAALLSAELICIERFSCTRRPVWIVAAAFASGLHLSNHNFALLSVPAIVLFVVVALRDRSLRPAALIGIAMAWLMGASPVIGLFVHLWRVNGDGLDILGQMLVGRFADNVYNVSSPWRLIAKMFLYTCYSFPTPLLFAAAFGVTGVVRRFGGSFATYFWAAAAVHLLFAIRYNVPDQHAFMLPSYVFLAVLIGLGVQSVLELRRTAAAGVIIVALSVVSPVVYWSVPSVLRDRWPDRRVVPRRVLPFRVNYDWFLKPWRTGNDGPQQFARLILGSLPKNAILVTDSTPMSPMLYFQNVESFRRDVRIVGASGYQSWFDQPFDLGSADRDLAIDLGRLFTLTADRSLWNHHLRDPMYQAEPVGPVFRIRRIRVAGDATLPAVKHSDSGWINSHPITSCPIIRTEFDRYSVLCDVPNLHVLNNV